MKELFRDGFMILVLLAVMLTPFFPILLKSKCPLCRKRKLEHLDTEKSEGTRGNTFITFYRCHNCRTEFQQEKSGPLKPRALSESNETHSASISV